MSASLGKLQTEKNNLELQLSKAENQKSLLEKAATERGNALEDLRSIMKTLEDEKNHLLKDCQKAKADFAKLQETFTDYKESLEMERSQVLDLKSNLKTKTSALVDKSSKIASLEVKINQMRGTMKESHVMVDSVKRECEEKTKRLKEKCAVLNERNIVLERALMDAEMDLQTHLRTESKLNESICSKDEKLAKVSAQLTSLDSTHAELLDQTRDTLLKTENNCTYLRETVASLENQLVECESKLDYADQCVAQTKHDLQNRDHTIALLRMELNSAQKSIERFRDEQPQKKDSPCSPQSPVSNYQRSKDTDEDFLRLSASAAAAMAARIEMQMRSMDAEDVEATTISGIDEFEDYVPVRNMIPLPKLTTHNPRTRQIVQADLKDGTVTVTVSVTPPCSPRSCSPLDDPPDSLSSNRAKFGSTEESLAQRQSVTHCNSRIMSEDVLLRKSKKFHATNTPNLRFSSEPSDLNS